VKVGVITGSGHYSLPDLEEASLEVVETPWGEVPVTRGVAGGCSILHIARHGEGHARLSSAVNHRANLFALQRLGAAAVVGFTACGALDSGLSLGSLVVFDDLNFLSNRLPDGSICTFFDQPGDPARAHWILHGGPYSPDLRALLLQGGAATSLNVRDGGVYGHVDGPRFNTPSEIAWLRGAGVTAVSQTGGPETVLCGELALPFALVGFVTDYANEVLPGATTPVSELEALLRRTPQAFAALLAATLPLLADAPPVRAAGTVFRIAGGA
jgi:purine nucleoside phosphorylase